jgi:hypothetical protein
MADDDEIEAMKKIATALEPLDDAARHRALQWATSRYRAVKPGDAVGTTIMRTSEMGGDTQANASPYQTFAELFEAANPGTERDKALVAAYWIQVCQNVGSFPSQLLNAELKDLGHGIGNITEALTQLKNERPALILQLKKSGTSKQARKTYKLTQEGAKRVQLMTTRPTSPSEPE